MPDNRRCEVNNLAFTVKLKRANTKQKKKRKEKRTDYRKSKAI